MGMFDRWRDDEEKEDSGFFGRRRGEDRGAKKRRAQEIADGTVLGTFERDEEVWTEVEKIKDKEM